MNVEQAVKEYQCPGCVGGPYKTCFKECTFGKGCESHCPGTLMFGVGKLFIGMPKGFNRCGPAEPTHTPIIILEDDIDFFDKFNVPVWKYLDEHGNTLVRGLSPRVNMPFLHIYLKDIREKVNCYELTKDDVEGMD